MKKIPSPKLTLVQPEIELDSCLCTTTRMSDMDGEDGMGEEGNRHRDFLVSMTSLSSGRDGEKSSGVEGGDGSSTDARFKLSHGNDDCPITEGQALSDLLGEAVTIDSLLKTAKEAAGICPVNCTVARATFQRCHHH